MEQAQGQLMHWPVVCRPSVFKFSHLRNHRKDVLKIDVRHQGEMRWSQKYLGLDERKPVFEGLLTTKAQTSLRIRAV